MNVNVDLMEENLIQNNGGIMINVYVRVKTLYLESWYIIITKLKKYLARFMNDSVITCDEITVSYDEGAKARWYNETKTILI